MISLHFRTPWLGLVDAQALPVTVDTQRREASAYNRGIQLPGPRPDGDETSDTDESSDDEGLGLGAMESVVVQLADGRLLRLPAALMEAVMQRQRNREAEDEAD